MHENELILIPEPTLGRYIFGGYTLDREATEAHYDSLFEGKTAEEVIRFLEERDKKISYNSENEISIFLERLVTFFYFGVGINFEFKDGVFERAKIWGAGVK